MKKDWKVRSRLAYMKCYKIRQKYQSNYKNRLAKCIIYSRANLASKYQYGINRYKIKKRKLCVYIKAQYINC